MQCKYHPSVEAVTNCQVCNTPLCNDCIANKNSAAPQCEKCVSFDGMAEVGVTNAIDAEERRKLLESSQDSEGINWKVVQIIIILIALILVPVQYVRVFGIPEVSPLNKTDKVEMADICIASLLRISRLLQQDKIPGDEFRCPISNHVYVVSYERDDVIVRDPNPELHGFTEFRVSKNHPVPVFRK